VRPDFEGVPDVLATICHDTLDEVSRRRQKTSIKAMRARIDARRGATRGFASTLAAAAAPGGRIGLIAEIKKASPSGGLIRPEFDPASLARAYVAGGASCLSVLTDGPYFGGSAEDLKAARAAVDLPVLRKDFILDPWQVYESRLIGADCILLILSVLTDTDAVELEGIARLLDMDVLVEVHDHRELTRALGLQTRLIGINNRNLRTLKTDLAVTEELASWVPPDRIVVAESGIANHADVLRMTAAGARCFLVGESLLRHADVTAATRALLGVHAPADVLP
jgi:indole-3-glycerol phosphate synthase